MIASKRKLYTLPILIFVMGVSASVWLLLWLIDLQKDKIARDFARVAGDRSAAVAQRLTNNFSVPESVRQLFDASDYVDENEFTTYVTPLLERTPELDSVAWAKQMVDADGKISHPIAYLEPQAGSDIGRGTFLESLPGLEKAIHAAIKNKRPEWTNLPSTKQDDHLPSDWLITLPVMPHVLPKEPPGEDQTSSSGVLLARVDLHQLMSRAFDSLERVGMDATIYQGTIDESNVLVRWFSLTRTNPYDPVKEKSASNYGFSRTVKIGGSDWIIYCRPAPHFLSKYQWWEQGFIFGGCLLMSGLMAAYLLRQRLAENELRKKNETVHLLENVAVAANEATADEELLKQSLRLICQYLGWPFGHVYVADQQEPEMLISSGIFEIGDEERFAAMRRETQEMRFAAGEGMPGRVSKLAKPVFIPDVNEFADFRRGKSAKITGLRSSFAFPVIVRNKVAAVLEFFDTNVSTSFAGWEELLSSMSVQMSHAMERRLVADEIAEKTAVLENAAEGIARVDLNGIYLSVNKAYAKMCGMPGAEMIGANGRAMVHPEDHVIFRAAYDEMLQTGRAEAKGRRMRPDGSIYYQELTLVRDVDRMGMARGCYLFSRDITEREEQQNALRNSEERFMAFMANNPASASIKDEDSRIVYINPACAEQFGFDPQEVVGKGPEELVKDIAAAKIVRDSDEALLRSNKPLQLVEVMADRDGKLRHWQVYKFPMQGQQGKRLIGVLCLDITERMEAEKAITDARDEALESARLKSQFLANMSHEIRTPMNGLIGMLGLLGRTGLQPRQRELLQTASSASGSLLRLLNDILDFSKIEAGKLEIDPIVFDPRQCVRHAVKILAEPARRKGLEMTYHVEDSVPEHIFGDSGRLSQIIVNLLNNGIKFTKQGSVTANLSVERLPKNFQLLLHCTIRDTGIGVSESHRQIIFEPFRQSDSSTARQYGGTGLGLAICSQLVGLMGGKIWVDSEPTGGSAFHFTVQMEESEEPLSSLPTDQPIQSRAAQSLRILLAEDNEINQQLAITLLEERGHHVVLARDGHEAVELFQNSSFDLILMDVQMPGKDGYETTLDIRHDPRGKTIPIYAITAHAMPEDRRRCMEVGMNDYLTKPIRVEEFARLVESKVEKSRSGKVDMFSAIKTRRIEWEPARNFSSGDVTTKKISLLPKSFDLQALRHLVNQNDALILQLATSFARQGAEDRDRIRTGLENHDAELVEASAHRLKGSALSLSATSLAKVSQAVETAARNQDLETVHQIWSSFEMAFDTLTSELDSLKN